jgi:hypothetical protein
MAMFLESPCSKAPSFNSLELLESFLESVIEYGDCVENLIQEEYTILSEESNETEEKKKGLVEKFKQLLLKTYDKFLKLLGNIKRKLVTTFKRNSKSSPKDGKSSSENGKSSASEIQNNESKSNMMYKSYYDYLFFIYSTMNSVVGDSVTETTVDEWKSKVWELQRSLKEENPVAVDKELVDKMVESVDKLYANLTDQVESLKTADNINPSIPKTIQKVFLALYHTLNTMNKAFYKK